MQRVPLVVGFVGLCLFSVLASAQSPPDTLCVAGMQVQTSANSDSKSRDLLVKYLDKEKADKAHPMEKVTVPVSVPADAMAYAKDKQCAYLLTTDETDSHMQGSLMTVGGTGQVNRQTFYVTVTYKLTKVSDGSEVSSGSFKTNDDASEQNAVGNAMKKIAGKVNEALHKGGK